MNRSPLQIIVFQNMQGKAKRYRKVGVMHIGISADDLTSATDAAIAFVKVGHVCEVWFDYRDTSEAKASVVSVNKNSRSLSTEQAENASRAAALNFASADILYHTVDSTIRGHLETEILAALETSGRKVALLAPAFPAAKRTTRNGVQRLDRKPVSRTAFTNDPVHPVRESRIRNHFPSLDDRDVHTIKLQDVWRFKPGSLHAGSHKLIIADAVTQADLNCLIDAVADPRAFLFCGSPGMAEALATRFHGRDSTSIHLPEVRTLLAIIGSANEQSAAQKRFLIASENAAEIVIDVGEATLSPENAAMAAFAQFKAASPKSKTIILGTNSSKGNKTDPAKIVEALALAASDIIRDYPIDGLTLTGGETAAAVFKKLGVKSIRLHSEIEPGIPLGIIDYPRPIVVLTKAGGFGTEAVFAKAAQKMRLKHQGKPS
jgi:D-threonate/D-erythronate kinase